MYVRKYDPPLFIDYDKTKQNVFMNVVDMNLPQEYKIPDNASIMKEVKNSVFKYEDALVNTLKYYNRG